MGIPSLMGGTRPEWGKGTTSAIGQTSWGCQPPMAQSTVEGGFNKHDIVVVLSVLLVVFVVLVVLVLLVVFVIGKLKLWGTCKLSQCWCFVLLCLCVCFSGHSHIPTKNNPLGDVYIPTENNPMIILPLILIILMIILIILILSVICFVLLYVC